MPPARAVLEDPDLPLRLRRLGLRPDDRADAEELVARVCGDVAALAEVDRLADALRTGLGRFPGEPGYDPWPGYDPAADPYGEGLLPFLALVATTPDLTAYHAGRGIPAEVSDATLAELGQQLWVHRLTYGRFGLHTYAWLPVTWSGSLYWLGRLQFNVQRLQTGWVCSTHIPRSGPLTPEAVDDSFARAADLVPGHFPDRPLTHLWCSSWLLDPTLADALDPASNMARFARRWHLYGEPMPGDEDAVFFTFARRGAVDLDALPQQTSLQRVIVQRLREGGHWQVRSGLIALDELGGLDGQGRP